MITANEVHLCSSILQVYIETLCNLGQYAFVIRGYCFFIIYFKAKRKQVS